MFDLQAARAFDNLYANTDGIADAFARAWSVVASGFRGDPMLLGYDLFNEPNPGSQWEACANPAGCPAFDQTSLEPLEDRLAAAVRPADRSAIAFYEPNIYFDSGVPSWLRAPPPASGPGGFAFHDYCLVAQLTGQPDHESAAPGYPACRPVDHQVFGNALRAATAMGVPPLFDEFGDTQDLGQIERVLKLADRNFTGWVYWSYKDWVDDPGGQGSGPLFDDSDDDGTLRTAKLAALSEPYPVATAGVPLSTRWDPTTGAFSYAYLPDRRISAPTVIFAAPTITPMATEWRWPAPGSCRPRAPATRAVAQSPGRSCPRPGDAHRRRHPYGSAGLGRALAGTPADRRRLEPHGESRRSERRLQGQRRPPRAGQLAADRGPRVTCSRGSSRAAAGARSPRRTGSPSPTGPATRRGSTWARCPPAAPPTRRSFAGREPWLRLRV